MIENKNDSIYDTRYEEGYDIKEYSQTIGT